MVRSFDRYLRELKLTGRANDYS